uniref:Noggin-3 n=1 Tax=Cacopsylla melanoneura TaxID=428564 RepID=A0A8D8QDQ3_9HEMI
MESFLLLLTTFIIPFSSTLDIKALEDRLGPDQLLQHEDLLRGNNLPLDNIWANERKPKVKPRKKDLFEPKLMALLGNDYETRWMKKSREPDEIRMGYDEFIDRKTIRTLRALVNTSSDTGISEEDDLQLPESLPPEYRELVKNWLIRRVTCPIKFKWHYLGELWYPRWVSKGECVEGAVSCSWPPGMVCLSSGSKVLHVLRWHCRKKKPKKRKKFNEENLLSSSNSSEVDEEKAKWKRYRQRHKCSWLKVPFPVPNDCACSCKG